MSVPIIDWFFESIGSGAKRNEGAEAITSTRLGRIAAGQTFKFIVPSAGTIKVACGLVWLTVSDDKKDYWLSGGQSQTLKAGQIVVLQAEAGQAVRWVYIAE